MAAVVGGKLAATEMGAVQAARAMARKIGQRETGRARATESACKMTTHTKIGMLCMRFPIILSVSFSSLDSFLCRLAGINNMVAVYL